MKRRRFLLGAATAGALLVGWGVAPVRSRIGHRESLASSAQAVALNGWLRFAEDGSVQLVMAQSEMGQGVHTALAMLVAEELDVPLASITLLQAGSDSRYGNVAAGVDAVLFFEPLDMEPGRQTRTVRAVQGLLAKAARELGVVATGGSSSIADLWHVLPLAAATARAQILGAASLLWKLPLAELQIHAGVVSHPSGPKAHFGELALRAAATPPGNVQRKPREQWRLIGQSPPRTDLAAKVDGSAVYAIDTRPEGLLFAVVRHSPMLGGSPGAVDVDAALRLPGVQRVVRLPAVAGASAALAVVGRSTWHAMQAARSLVVQWHPPVQATVDSRSVRAALERHATSAMQGDSGFAFRDRGHVDSALAQGTRTLQATYHAPYLAHAAMEPMNCTAQVLPGRVRLWAPTQVPSFARAAAARAAGVAESAVELIVTPLGGGFGRRLEVDFIAQAVHVATETGGRPVQLLWPREEDFGHDFYRPAAAAVLQAVLDEAGQPIALAVGSASDAVLPRYCERCYPLFATPLDLPDKTTAEGLFDLPYAIAHLRVRHHATRSGVPVGSWRSVGHSHNAFFAESFIDELAHAANTDPVAYRLALLQQMPRHAAVLQRAAAAAGWGQPLPAGQARGVALHESFGTIVAMVVQASLDAEQRPRVHRVVVAVDCGTVVHPGIVAQQVEGSVVFGLTAALFGRIDIRNSVVQQRNFPDQPLLTMAQTPAIETHILPSTRDPSGMGEPAVPPVAPALANALFVLTGRRQRELPLGA